MPDRDPKRDPEPGDVLILSSGQRCECVARTRTTLDARQWGNIQRGVPVAMWRAAAVGAMVLARADLPRTEPRSEP